MAIKDKLKGVGKRIGNAKENATSKRWWKKQYLVPNKHAKPLFWSTVGAVALTAALWGADNYQARQLKNQFPIGNPDAYHQAYAEQVRESPILTQHTKDWFATHYAQRNLPSNTGLETMTDSAWDNSFGMETTDTTGTFVTNLAADPDLYSSPSDPLPDVTQQEIVQADTAVTTTIAPAPVVPDAQPSEPAQKIVVNLPQDTPSEPFTYEASDKQMTFVTQQPHLGPATIVFNTGDRSFYTPVATMQDRELGFTEPIYTAEKLINGTDVIARGVVATPFADVTLSQNVQQIYSKSLIDGQSITVEAPSGASIYASQRFNAPDVLERIADKEISAADAQSLEGKILWFTADGEESFLVPIIVSYGTPENALPAVSSTQAVKTYQRDAPVRARTTPTDVTQQEIVTSRSYVESAVYEQIGGDSLHDSSSARGQDDSLGNVVSTGVQHTSSGYSVNLPHLWESDSRAARGIRRGIEQGIAGYIAPADVTQQEIVQTPRVDWDRVVPSSGVRYIPPSN